MAVLLELPRGKRRSVYGKDAAGLRLLALVAASQGVSVEALLQPSRGKAEIALARQLAMYLMHVSLQRIYADVGAFFGRDRTTVAHACALIEDRRELAAFDRTVERLEQLLEAEPEETRHAG